MEANHKSILPQEWSINDGIDPDLCSSLYVTMDTMARMVEALGAKGLMAEMDIELAYHLIPVHPDDCLPLGIQWSGKVITLSMHGHLFLLMVPRLSSVGRSEHESLSTPTCIDLQDGGDIKPLLMSIDEFSTHTKAKLLTLMNDPTKKFLIYQINYVHCFT